MERNADSSTSSSTSANSSSSSLEQRWLSLQSLPPEIVALILSYVKEEELWRLRNLCHAFKSVYESSVRLKFYSLLPHIESHIEKLHQAVENSHFSLEKLRLSQARKMLLLKFTYREALMFTVMIWRQSFDPEAWSVICHAASLVVDEFYTFINKSSLNWSRLLDFTVLQNRLRAWNAFQNTFTTRIEPHLAQGNTPSIPLSTQVVDVLDCSLYANWDCRLELNPEVGTQAGTFAIEYWMRFRNESRRAPSELMARAGDEAANQRAALLRFLRRAVSENTLAEFNRILNELEPLEKNVARTFAHNIPDTMVAEMSRVYGRVFQAYPRPWPMLTTVDNHQRLTRHLDYDVATSETHIRLTLTGIPRQHLPLSFWQESLRDRLRLVSTRNAPATPFKWRRGRRNKRCSNALFIETTKKSMKTLRFSRVIKSCVTVRNVDGDFTVRSSIRRFKLQ